MKCHIFLHFEAVKKNQIRLDIRVKTCLLKAATQKKTKSSFFFKTYDRLNQAKVLQNAPVEHSAVLLASIKLPHGCKTFVFCIFEWPLKTGFTIHWNCMLADD